MNAEDTLLLLVAAAGAKKAMLLLFPYEEVVSPQTTIILFQKLKVFYSKLSGTKPFDEFEEPKNLGILTKPVLIGPCTLLDWLITPEANKRLKLQMS